MMDVGRVCVKIAGRDAGKQCVIVDVVDERHVLIDGLTRRRKCNLMHLEPLAVVVDLKKGADHGAVVIALKSVGIEVPEVKKGTKERKKNPGRPVKQKVKHEKVAKVKKAPQVEKKEAPKKAAPVEKKVEEKKPEEAPVKKE
jgi:large subunit ribosomal protein L14e